jgi:hypothetical protein
MAFLRMAPRSKKRVLFESIERRQNVLEHRSELSRLAVNASLPRDRVSGWLIAMLCTIAAVNGFVFVQDVVNGASLYFAFYAELGKVALEAIGELLGLKDNKQERFLTPID